MKRHNPLLLAAALAPLLALGCHDRVTEVVLLLTTDLSVPADADSVTIMAAPGFDPPAQFNGIGAVNALQTSFPMSVGFTSSGSTDVFSTTIQFTKASSVNFTTSLVVTRNITGIRFVPGETRMLTVAFLAVCACHGTSCPNPGINPECDNLANPVTVPFDPTVAPPSTPYASQFGGRPGGGIMTPPSPGRDAAGVTVMADGGAASTDGRAIDAGAGETGRADGPAIDGGAIDGARADGAGIDGDVLDGGSVDGGKASDGGATDGADGGMGAADGGGVADARAG